jgi:hypothetical protein
VKSEVNGTANLADRAGRSEDGLRGDTAGMQTVTAEAVAFEEGDARTEASRSDRADQACGAAADDDEVVQNAGFWILPAVGTHQPIETRFNVLKRQTRGHCRLSSAVPES